MHARPLDDFLKMLSLEGTLFKSTFYRIALNPGFLQKLE